MKHFYGGSNVSIVLRLKEREKAIMENKTVLWGFSSIMFIVLRLKEREKATMENKTLLWGFQL